MIPFLQKQDVEDPRRDRDDLTIHGFLDLVTYVRGSYDGPEGWQSLNRAIRESETARDPCAPRGRLFYLALPPTVYPEVCEGLARHCCGRDPDLWGEHGEGPSSPRVQVAVGSSGPIPLPDALAPSKKAHRKEGPSDAGEDSLGASSSSRPPLPPSPVPVPGSPSSPSSRATTPRSRDPFAPTLLPPGSWTRVVVEKPFGHDTASSERLAGQLAPLFPESQLYRIDHYLGKEMTQNMLVVRFANMLFAPTWNRESVSNVQITFKENFGTEGRGGYFDSFGIIRDVLQNHLCQLLAYVAMEKPVSAHPDDVRDSKVQALRCVLPVEPEDVVVGQYEGADGKPGYKDDETVPGDSRTPTFAQVVLYLDNDRWAGVPFILRAGKALDERKAEIRIQFRAPAHTIWPAAVSEDADEARKLNEQAHRGSAKAGGAATGNTGASSAPAAAGEEAVASQPSRLAPVSLPSQRLDSQPSVDSPTQARRLAARRARRLRIEQSEGMRNELVVRLQPDEAMYAKLVIKKPGMGMDITISELDLDYRCRYPDAIIPDAYPKLILDAIKGDQQHFVRRDELRAAWEIFTPVLEDVESGRIPLVGYKYGSRGPHEALEQRKRVGWVKNNAYKWEPSVMACGKL